MGDMIPDRVRERDLVGYGRLPPRFAWPDAARVVVNIVLVYEEGSEYSVLWGDDRNDGWGEYADPGVQPPQRDKGTESHYEYGSRAGVWRLARIFEAAGIPVTVSAAAVALELNPPVAAWMREHDHDLLGHGWRWIEHWTLSREQEREALAQAIETYERVLGARPLGWNCRGWPSENTRELLIETGGFLYDSDSSADDVPFYERSRRAAVPGHPLFEDLQRLPLPDESGLRQPARLPGHADDGAGRAAARRRAAAGDDDRRRPRALVGQAARAAAVRLFLEHARAQPGVRFMRRRDIATWWLEHNPPL